MKQGQWLSLPSEVQKIWKKYRRSSIPAVSIFAIFDLEEFIFLPFSTSAAASGWAEWALAHPEFGSSVNLITTRGADYAHHITASPPGFENLAASLIAESSAH